MVNKVKLLLFILSKCSTDMLESDMMNMIDKIFRGGMKIVAL